MKMLHECRAAHVLWVIWNAAFDGGIHLKILPRERSMSGQIFSSYLCDHTQPVCTADVHGTRCLLTLARTWGDATPQTSFLGCTLQFLR